MTGAGTGSGAGSAGMAPAPFRSLLRRVHRLSSRDEVRGHAQRVREMAAALSAGGADALEIAELAARLGGALVRRLAALFQAERPAPAAWAWLALGSEARREQPLPTDQDHALAFAPAGGAEGWARALAERLGEDLEAAGFPPCQGGMMASRWHAALGTWCDRLERWMEDPAPDSLLGAAALADGRRVAGRLDAGPLQAALLRAPEHPRFVRELVRAALEFRPPSSLQVRLGTGSLDLEREALAPLVLLARVYGLAARSVERRTCARLEAARAAGLLGGDAAAGAAAAFRLLAGLRLGAGLRGEGSARLDLASLGRGEREAVLRALGAVRRLRERAAHRFLG